MLDCKHKQHRHGRPQKFFQGRQSRHFGCPFQAADDTNANRRSHNALPLLHHKKMTHVNCNSPKNPLRWQQCFFSHRIKLVGSNISFQFSHRATDVCVQQSHAGCSKTPTAVNFEPLLPCYCYAIKANFKTILPQLSQPASAGNVADLVNCKLISHHCMIPEQ